MASLFLTLTFLSAALAPCISTETLGVIISEHSGSTDLSGVTDDDVYEGRSDLDLAAPAPGEDQVAALENWLINKNLTAYHALLDKNGIFEKMGETLDFGGVYTLLAFVDSMIPGTVDSYKPPSICSPVENAEADKFTVSGFTAMHVLKGKYPASDLAELPVGQKIPTFSAFPLTLLSTSPVSLGSVNGVGRVLRSARIMEADSFTADSFVVHLVNKIVLYPNFSE